MIDKPTNELEEILLDMPPEKIRAYLQENQAYMADENKGFYYYMKDVIENKGLFLKDIYSFAGVSSDCATSSLVS